MFHGNSAHHGNPNTTGPSNNQTLWVFKTNGDVWSSPAVADGIVYVGSFDRYLYAVNATDGSKVWSFKTGGTIFTSPAVANNVVYIGSDDHNIYALDAQSGSLIWNYTTGGAAECSPTVAGGIFTLAQTTTTSTP